MLVMFKAAKSQKNIWIFPVCCWVLEWILFLTVTPRETSASLWCGSKPRGPWTGDASSCSMNSHSNTRVGFVHWPLQFTWLKLRCQTHPNIPQCRRHMTPFHICMQEILRKNIRRQPKFGCCWPGVSEKEPKTGRAEPAGHLLMTRTAKIHDSTERGTEEQTEAVWKDQLCWPGVIWLRAPQEHSPPICSDQHLLDKNHSLHSS